MTAARESCCITRQCNGPCRRYGYWWSGAARAPARPLIATTLSTMADADWPFDQPRNCAVISLRSIVFDGAPILLVSHDADDHGWQFLNGGAFDVADAAVVLLANIVRQDPSVLQVADLPPGWQAWRDAPSAPWQRAPSPPDDAQPAKCSGPPRGAGESNGRGRRVGR